MPRLQRARRPRCVLVPWPSWPCWGTGRDARGTSAGPPRSRAPRASGQAGAKQNSPPESGEHVPHFLLDTGALQPRRGVLAQPRRKAWVGSALQRRQPGRGAIDVSETPLGRAPPAGISPLQGSRTITAPFSSQAAGLGFGILPRWGSHAHRHPPCPAEARGKDQLHQERPERERRGSFQVARPGAGPRFDA